MSTPATALLPITLAIGLAVPSPESIAGELPGFYHPWNDTDLAGVAKLNGNVTFSVPSNQVTGVVGGGGVFQGITGSIEMRGAITADVVATAAGSFVQQVPLAVLPLPVVPVTGNIELAPFLGLVGVVAGTVEAGARFALMEQFESTFSLSLGSSGLSAGLLGDPKTVHRFAPPEASGGTQIEFGVTIVAGISFQILVSGIPIGGPTVMSAIGLGAVVEPLANPWWSIDAALTSSVLWLGPGFILASTPVHPPIFTPVADAGGPFALMPSPARWSRTYDLGGDEDVTGAIALTDGFLVTGNGMGVSNRAYLAKIGLDGAPLWEKRAQQLPFGSFRPNSIAAAANGDILLGGFTATSGGGRIDRFDGSGNPLWSKILAGPVSTSLQVHSMIAGENDTAIVAGEITYVGSNVSHPIVAQVDSTGTIQWAKEFDPGAASTNGRFRKVIATRDGGLMLVGTMTYTDVPAPNSTIAQPNIFAVKLNANQFVTFAKVIGTTQWDEAFCVAEGADGIFLVGGQTPSWAASNVHAALMVAVYPNGELKWSKVYAGEVIGGSSGDTTYDAIDGIVAIEGGFAVTGYTGLPNATRDSWLFVVDDDGVATSFKSFRSPEHDEFRGLAAIDGGSAGFVAYGFTAQIGLQRDFWLVRAQVDGYLDFASQYGFDCVNDDMDWGVANDVVAMTMPGSLIDVAFTSSAGAQGFDVVASTPTVLTP